MGIDKGGSEMATPIGHMYSHYKQSLLSSFSTNIPPSTNSDSELLEPPNENGFIQSSKISNVWHGGLQSDANRRVADSPVLEAQYNGSRYHAEDAAFPDTDRSGFLAESADSTKPNWGIYNEISSRLSSLERNLASMQRYANLAQNELVKCCDFVRIPIANAKADCRSEEFHHLCDRLTTIMDSLMSCNLIGGDMAANLAQKGALLELRSIAQALVKGLGLQGEYQFEGSIDDSCKVENILGRLSVKRCLYTASKRNPELPFVMAIDHIIDEVILFEFSFRYVKVANSKIKKMQKEVDGLHSGLEEQLALMIARVDSECAGRN